MAFNPEYLSYGGAVYRFRKSKANRLAHMRYASLPQSKQLYANVEGMSANTSCVRYPLSLTAQVLNGEINLVSKITSGGKER